MITIYFSYTVIWTTGKKLLDESEALSEKFQLIVPLAVTEGFHLF